MIHTLGGDIISKVNVEHYVVIQGWMPKELNLQGSKLIIYAIIYGFTQEKGKFSGSLQYLADWTNSSRRNVLRNLQALCEQGLLLKISEKGKNRRFCEYKALKGVSCSAGEKQNKNSLKEGQIVLKDVDKSSPAMGQTVPESVDKSSPALGQNVTDTMDKKSHNNIIDTIIDKLDNNLYNNLDSQTGESKGHLDLEKPTLEQVQSYCNMRKSNIDPVKFWGHYEALHWRIAGEPIRDWMALVRNWEKREQTPPAAYRTFQRHGGFTAEDFQQMQDYISGKR